MDTAPRSLARFRRIVVKVGSSLLVDGRTGKLDRAWLDSLTADLKALADAAGRKPLAVSAATGMGLEQVLDACLTLIDRLEENRAEAAESGGWSPGL